MTMLSLVELLQERDLHPQTQLFLRGLFLGTTNLQFADIGALCDSTTLSGDIAQMDTKRP